jgi:hypothetical protein
MSLRREGSEILLAGLKRLSLLIGGALKRKHPVNNAAREVLGGLVGPRLITNAGLLQRVQ